MQLRSPRRCKEMPVIPVNKVVDPKRIIGKKWRAKEEERHKGSLTTPPKKKNWFVLRIFNSEPLSDHIGVFQQSFQPFPEHSCFKKQTLMPVWAFQDGV
jgi:hypothetical protein